MACDTKLRQAQIAEEKEGLHSGRDCIPHHGSAEVWCLVRRVFSGHSGTQLAAVRPDHVYHISLA